MTDAARIVEVSLGTRSYRVHVGAGLLDAGGPIAEAVPAKQVMVVSDADVAPLYMERVVSALPGRETRTLVLPAGEAGKTLAGFGQVIDALAAAGFNRDCTVVALGGGVVGDLAGFAAACYQRGVACVQVPTTLLAQVDAAVGGKTAVNHPAGKNLVGAFHQPLAVVADVTTLGTLPSRDYRAGLAEVVKYGAGLDARFFGWLEGHMDALLARDREALVEAVARCCELKAGVVADDEREAGRRALLNLGHTFGHAIEAATGFGAWLHGEAVAAGMVMAARLSARLGRLNEEDADRIEALLDRAGLPVAPPQVGAGALRALMGLDKKVLAGRVRLVLLDGIGASSVTADADPAALEAVLAAADPP